MREYGIYILAIMTMLLCGVTGAIVWEHITGALSNISIETLRGTSATMVEARELLEQKNARINALKNGLDGALDELDSANELVADLIVADLMAADGGVNALTYNDLDNRAAALCAIATEMRKEAGE